MASIFSKIISGEIPSYKIAETESFLAFLDVRPLALGHTLVIPKKETDYIFDLEDEEYAALMMFAKIIAHAVKKTVPCIKVGVAVIGLEVPHVHIHLVPMQQIGDLNFEKERCHFTDEVYKNLAKSIASNIE
jgi:histidine triad (HIT) family protein